MDQVMAEEEEKMSMSQSQKNSTHRSMQEPENGGDEDDEEEEEDSDEEGHNVFYKARELIVSLSTSNKLSTRVFSRFLNKKIKTICFLFLLITRKLFVCSTNRRVWKGNGSASTASPSTSTLTRRRWRSSMTVSTIWMRTARRPSASTS